MEYFFELALKLHDQGSDWSSIRKSLEKEADLPKEAIDEIMLKCKEIYYAKRRKRGTRLVLFGCVLLLIGFATTIVLYNQNMPTGIPMYGVTSLGLIILFIGLIDVMGF